MNELPQVDEGNLTVFVMEQTGHDRETVTTVLAVEEEHMIARGIIVADRHRYEWRYYDPSDLPEVSNCIDTDEVAADVERFTGIGRDVAEQVMFAELSYLEYRGLA